MTMSSWKRVALLGLLALCQVFTRGIGSDAPQKSSGDTKMDSSTISTDYGAVGTELGVLGTDSDDIGTDSGTLGIDTGAIGTDSGILGTDSTDLSALCTDSDNLGTDSGTLGTDTGAIGTDSGILGTDSTDLSALGTDSDTLGTDSGTLGTDSGALVTNSPGIGSGVDPASPHVVFVLMDDYGFNDIGYHAKDHQSAIRTPTLDKLAEEGVKLENYYVQPSCTPTRSQLMTGRYQIHTGLQHRVLHPTQASSVPLDEVLLPMKLRQHGYSTHMVGKWHLGYYRDECLPTERGFDSFFGLYLGSSDHFKHRRTVLGRGGLDLHDNKDPARDYTGKYSTQIFTSKAIDVIKRHNKSQPLFMYVSYQATHDPLQVPDPYRDHYKGIGDADRRRYAGMVKYADEAVGDLVDALKDAGLYENTVLIFSTDNGGAVHFGGNNWPLRGTKGSLWEGGVRGVGFVHSPLLPEYVRGTVNRELVHVSDWLPTIVAGIAGGSLEGTKPLDGYNVWDSIRNNTPSPRTELLHNIDPLHVGGNDFNPKHFWTDVERKTLTNWPHYQNFSTEIQAALRVGDWKIQTGGQVSKKNFWMPPAESGLFPVYPTAPDSKRVWLFNISADPLEQHDLSLQYPDVVEDLLDRLDGYYQGSVPVRYPEFDPNMDTGLWGNVFGPWIGLKQDKN